MKGLFIWVKILAHVAIVIFFTIHAFDGRMFCSWLRLPCIEAARKMDAKIFFFS